jgi:hypothetical protein
MPPKYLHFLPHTVQANAFFRLAFFFIGASLSFP